jgi:hypothetical protein
MTPFLHALRQMLVQAAYRVAFWVGLGTTIALGLLLVLFLVARTAIRPAPGAWATTVLVGPVAVDVGVPSLIWLGTTPWVAQRLDGHSVPTAMGPLRLGWDAQANTLSLHCQPCSIRNPSWGSEALRLEAVHVTVHRVGMQLRGTVASGAVTARWSGQLTPSSLLLELDLPPTAARDGYALFASAIPELARAHIDGTFSLHATLSLPSQALTLQPQLEGLTVQGLGTEQWAQARSACAAGLPPSAMGAPLGPQSLLARAVVAAEDQRFYEHPGYDLVEVTHALHSNQRAAVPLRGASTLSQQVAKLLVTGGERSPVRKLRELLYAVEMEQTLGKARILRLYLDNAPWGATVCGAQAAAHTYFGKRADRLNAYEAVWLAAMLHNPALEARRWASTGHINQRRAQWVARGMPRKLLMRP